jgi:hypothetical protein
MFLDLRFFHKLGNSYIYQLSSLFCVIEFSSPDRFSVVVSSSGVVLFSIVVGISVVWVVGLSASWSIDQLFCDQKNSSGVGWFCCCRMISPSEFFPVSFCKYDSRSDNCLSNSSVLICIPFSISVNSVDAFLYKNKLYFVTSLSLFFFPITVYCLQTSI